MRLLHALAKTIASFDDPHLVSHAGLVPVMALAERAGLGGLVAEHVRPAGGCGVNARLKVPALVAGMAAGADSIDDIAVLRHGAMSTVFGAVRAPSTLGSHPRSYTWGNALQREKAGRALLAELARRAPLLAGRDVLAFVDIDSMQKRVYGHAKQGAKFGHTKIQGKSVLVRGLNALAATISTARDCGCTGQIIVRMDSAYYNASVIGAIRRQGARFSVTVPVNSSVRAAIAAIPEGAWTAIRYPQAIWDDQLDCWISDAEVAETQYTAFASKKDQAVTARLIVRRVGDQNKKAAHGMDELFPVWRHHTAFTDSRSSSSRPRGSTAATPSWSRSSPTSPAAGSLASLAFAKARAATIRRDLIAVATRTARHGRGHLVLHLPEGWHREQEWRNLWDAACGPPSAAA